MEESEAQQDELPHFGKTEGEISFIDPLASEHEEIQSLMQKIDSKKEDEAPKVMSNDDSFTNFVAPKD